MTDKAIELARECGFVVANAAPGYEIIPCASPEQIELLIAKVQDAALREAAEKFVDDPKPWQNPVEFLRRMAEEKGKK